MTTGTDEAPARAPMTLAELRAVSAIISPAQAGNLSPVFALVELYAIRANKTLLQVWEMPAVEAVSSMLEMLPDILTTDMQQAAGEASIQIGAQLNPQAIRDKLMQRLRLVA
jgi:hypothetical protein